MRLMGSAAAGWIGGQSVRVKGGARQPGLDFGESARAKVLNVEEIEVLLAYLITQKIDWEMKETS